MTFSAKNKLKKMHTQLVGLKIRSCFDQTQNQRISSLLTEFFKDKEFQLTIDGDKDSSNENSGQMGIISSPACPTFVVAY